MDSSVSRLAMQLTIILMLRHNINAITSMAIKYIERSRWRKMLLFKILLTKPWFPQNSFINLQTWAGRINENKLKILKLTKNSRGFLLTLTDLFFFGGYKNELESTVGSCSVTLNLIIYYCHCTAEFYKRVSQWVSLS